MSHKGTWWSECPGSVPGINSGRSRDTRDVWADLCRNSHSRGRMFAGQTGRMTGQMGHVHGTDGTQTRGCPAIILYVYWFFLSRYKSVALSNFYCRGVPAKNSAFGRSSSLAPMLTPSKAQPLLLLSSRRLWKSVVYQALGCLVWRQDVGPLYWCVQGCDSP